MIDTQSALNSGIPVAPQVEAWLTESFGKRESSVIDPLFGCSTVLPFLMVRESKPNLMDKY